jgi:hypothetical protein
MSGKYVWLGKSYPALIWGQFPIFMGGGGSFYFLDYLSIQLEPFRGSFNLLGLENLQDKFSYELGLSSFG